MTSSIRKIAETKGSKKKLSKREIDRCLKQLYVEYIKKRKSSKPNKIVGGENFPVSVGEMLNISSLKFAPYTPNVENIQNSPRSHFESHLE